VLPQFHAELCAVLAPLGKEYEIEIIYVDDGSRDRTLEVLRQLTQADHRVRYLSLTRNFGKEAALTAGLQHACGDAVITLDSDLQHPPALIPTLLTKWHEGHDLVLTLRANNADLSLFKRLSARVFYQAMTLLCDKGVRPEISDYQLLSRRAVEGLLELEEAHRFLRGLVCWLGFPTTTIPFQVAPRAAGASKFTLRPLLTLATNGMVSFSKVPLRLALGLGGLLAATGLVYALGAVVAALFGLGRGNWGHHAVLVLLYAITGAILCALGIVGEYVGRLYEQMKGRPLYFLKERWPAANNTTSKAHASHTEDTSAA
jgi:dolichol-phosphate mannosyltransferase